MEKLIVNQKKEIINQIVQKMSEENPDLYYTDTSTLANKIVDHIHVHEKDLKKDEYDLVKDMDFRDIAILMSFTSDEV